MKLPTILLASLMVSLSLPHFNQAIAPVQAAQLSDGSVSFDRPPLLVNTTAAQSRRTQAGMYYFTINLPVDAGASLSQIRILPKSSDRRLSFDIDQTEAFFGDLAHPGTAIELQTVEVEEETNNLHITFAQPLPPNSTVTIGLQPSRTPNRRRTYQFDITAIPAAATPAPISIGNARFNFQGRRYRDYPFWWNPDDIFPFYNESDHRVLFWDLPPEFDIRLRQRRQQSRP